MQQFNQSHLQLKEHFPLLSVTHAAPGATLWLSACLCLSPPSVVCSQYRYEGGNVAAFRAHLISWAGERERYSRHSWDMWGVPAPAETYSKLLQPKMVHVPSPRSWPLVVGLLAEPSCSDSQEDVGSGPCPLIAWLLLRALRSRPWWPPVFCLWDLCHLSYIWSCRPQVAHPPTGFVNAESYVLCAYSVGIFLWR